MDAAVAGWHSLKKRIPKNIEMKCSFPAKCRNICVQWRCTYIYHFMLLLLTCVIITEQIPWTSPWATSYTRAHYYILSSQTRHAKCARVAVCQCVPLSAIWIRCIHWVTWVDRCPISIKFNFFSSRQFSGTSIFMSHIFFFVCFSVHASRSLFSFLLSSWTFCNWVNLA